jgi:hypothetical protein
MDVVYIDGQLIDLDPNTKIAWTIQRVDIGDLSKNYASFSNTIKASDTERNNRVFQNAKLVNSNGTFQYALQDCKVVQNGIETINGKCQIIGFDGENYSIVIYDSFVSIISFIEGKDLSNIDFGNSSWAASAIDAARLNTSNFVAAVMNWGRSSIYEQNYFLPCYFYGTLIQKILQLTGYSLSASILSNSDLTDLVCTPITAFKYKDGYNNSNVPTTSTFNFFNTSNQVDMVMPVQNVPFGIRANIKITVNFTSITFTKGGGSTSNVVVEAAGVTVGTFGTGTPITANTSGTFVYEFNDQTLITSQTITIRIRYIKDAGFPTDNVTIITFAPSCKVEIVDTLNVVRTNVYWNRLASKTSLKDILKDFFVRFGIVYKLQGNTLILKTLEEICNDTGNAVDWTNKRVNRKKSAIDFKTNYAQANYFLHNDDAKDKFLGSGNLSIANTALQAVKDFFTSVFANVKRWTGTGYEVMSYAAYDSTSTGIDDVKDEPPLMIGTLKSRTNEAAITFDSTPRTDYKLAYHADASQPKDSSFRYFISKFYPSLSFALQKNKICKHEYNLTETDIANYDPHKMIFDSGSYYLLNKIDKYNSGRTKGAGSITKVELFKIQ